jgi:hypothetical protein
MCDARSSFRPCVIQSEAKNPDSFFPLQGDPRTIRRYSSPLPERERIKGEGPYTARDLSRARFKIPRLIQNLGVEGSSRALYVTPEATCYRRSRP